jgi:hypothetical protein
MRKSIKPQSRRHIWMYDEDWDYIHAHVAPRTQLAPGSWTREILHTIVLQIREERRQSQEASEKLWSHATRDSTTSSDGNKAQ